MKNILTIAIIGIAGILSACGGVLSEGGLDGRFVNDGLPDNAVIYRQEFDKAGEKGKIVPGTESEVTDDMIDVIYNGVVPCSDIKGVDWWAQIGDGEIELPLARCQYGCKYLPSPGGNFSWNRPSILVSRDPIEGLAFTLGEAEKLAEYCAVPLQVRN